jgi:hypothetical protein
VPPALVSCWPHDLWRRSYWLGVAAPYVRFATHPRDEVDTMRKLDNLDEYKNVLPYASEIFGVYQPLLGWKSKRLRERFEKGFRADLAHLHRKLFKNIEPLVDVRQAERDGRERRLIEIGDVKLGRILVSKRENTSFLVDELRRRVPEGGEDPDWNELLDPQTLQSALDRVVQEELSPAAVAGLQIDITNTQHLNALVLEQAARESRMAGYLQQLVSNKDTAALKDLFATKSNVWAMVKDFLPYKDPFDYIDPNNDLDRVVVSPISVVHLFRQYFYEFDTFLGTPVGHIWLSPGSQVELVEISTRKAITERTFASEFEMITKTEKEAKELDELSTSVKDENQSNTKFGFTTTVNQGWVGGSATATGSINLDKTQKQAREVSHKKMRQQTERLSTQIRNNYKSTFKTVSETTDTSSKRYLLNNTTSDLINYEMRRKMRQVGVQVQDIGTYLCWQTYVDDPGRMLGIANLVHLAEPPDLASIGEADSIDVPGNVSTQLAISIPFEPRTEDTGSGDMDETYRNGIETDTDAAEGTPEKVRHKFRGFTASCDQAGFRYDSMTFDNNGNDIRLELLGDVEETIPGKIKFDVKVKHVNFHDISPLAVTANIVWAPSDDYLTKIHDENEKNIENFNAETHRKFQEAYMKAARERIKVASEVEARPFDDLREEERIVVYRRLIQDMLMKDLDLPDDRTRHAVAELLNSIFDIDKMLYFVAPEWWRPRLHESQQHLGGPEGGSGSGGSSGPGSVYAIADKKKLGFALQQLGPFQQLAPPPIPEHNVVSWGGANEIGRDNYYITEESKPARMGSSLGWLLQLDGDGLRNAFLNAPWVKGVIPIRPGKERAAFNWLQGVKVEGTDGLGAEYVAPAAELAGIPHSGAKATIRDAIFHLCEQVKQKHEESMTTGRHPEEEINDDNKVNATPIDKVYEHGFYPNQDGFKIDPDQPFEIFDQWVEILPTDQVAPVEVEYDPITGRQIRN